MLKLRLPAGTLASLREAADNGADSVYTGLASATNARNFPGLNLSPEELAEGVEYAHARGTQVLVASNIYPQQAVDASLRTVDLIAASGADAVIATDISVLGYAAETYPSLARHLSVIASATNGPAIEFYRENFGVSCVVLPRVTSLDEIREIRSETDVELEVFAFGVL